MTPDSAQSSDQFLASLDVEIERLQRLRVQLAGALGVPAKAPARKTLAKKAAVKKVAQEKAAA